MNANTISLNRSINWLKIMVFLGGVLYTLTGLALLFAPVWFLENIGKFPPFNRHYMGDLGSFLLPLGVGLLIASRDPIRYNLLVSVVLAGNFLHGFNHLYDSVIGKEPLSHWLSDTLPIIVFAVLYILAYWRTGREIGNKMLNEDNPIKTKLPAKS